MSEIRQWKYGPVHKHDHYPWHYMDRKHRPLNLNPRYPLKTQSEIILEKMKRYNKTFGKWFPVDTADIEKEVKRYQYVLGTYNKKWHGIDIFLKAILPYVEKKVDEREDWKHWIAFFWVHEIVYMHEVLHLLWHWERSYEENKAKNLEQEEEIINRVSRMINEYLFLT